MGERDPRAGRELSKAEAAIRKADGDAEEEPEIARRSAKAAAKAMIGAKIPGRTTLCTMLCHSTPSDPDWTSAAPMRPPMSACEELDGKPSHHVIRFHVIAPKSAARTVLSVARPVSMIPFPTVAATAVVTNAPARLASDCDEDGHPRSQRPCRDGGRDGVGRVVKAVREVEAQRDDDHQDEETVAHGPVTCS